MSMYFRNEDFLNALSDSTFSFQEQVYTCHVKDAQKVDYSFSNTDNLIEKYAAYVLKNQKNVEIDCKNATFCFTGHLTPFLFDSCENVTLKNLTIDFDPPLVAEGKVIARQQNIADVQIDTAQFPCVVKEGWLYFYNTQEELSPMTKWSQIHFDKYFHVNTNSGDDFVVQKVEQLSNNTFRLIAKDCPAQKAPVVGDYFVLRHNARRHPGIFMENCKNIKLQNITVHSCGGLGVLCQFCEDLDFSSVHFEPNRKKGRHICSGRDDGFQIASCKGHVQIQNCSFLGLMDDPVNVHGCSVRVAEFVDAHTVKIRFMHEQANDFEYFARENDSVVLMKENDYVPLTEYTVQKSQKCSKEEMLLTFYEEIKEKDIEGYIALENLTNTPSFTCKNNIFGSTRARGLLVTTPKKVLIEDNLFQSSGSGILLSGDCASWYESGACHDVTIRRNTFLDQTMSSMYQFTYGMISLCPTHKQPSLEHPFHDHILIEDNVFYTPDAPVLYAYSAQNLVLQNNRIFRSLAGKNVTPFDALVVLDSCKEVLLKDNVYVGSNKNDICKIIIHQCEDVKSQDFLKA